jgi:glycosyltransferase involved in cell wall biosynthesis
LAVEAMISVLQSTAWYPPRHMGGTEVYLTSLVRELRTFEISSRVIAPLAPEAADRYEFDGTVVRTYPANPVPFAAKHRGESPQQGLERFRQILAEEQPEIYHQHSWIGDLGGEHLRTAREAGLKTVLTVHTPHAICLRGTMVRFGREACDGLIDPSVCGACWSNERGAPKMIARSLGAISPAMSGALGRSVPYRRVARALSARWLAEQHKSEFARMVADADRIVAVCGWVFDALEHNGVRKEKLLLSRQGVDPAFAAQAVGRFEGQECDRDRDFRLLYLGHWHPVKGIDVLIRAVRALPKSAGLKLVIHGVANSAQDRDYAAEICRLVAGDPRIAIEPPIPRPQLFTTLTRASALAVPSLWLETGPLVVLEAKAAGLPVIGSRLGGIAELVREPEDGMLVAPGNVMAWAAAIQTMASNRRARAVSRTAGEVRTMREVASDMATLYNSLC